MAKSFDTIIESTMRRYNQNTFIVGDRVKFIDNLDSHDWMKRQPAVKLERLKELIESGQNIRISAVKTMRPQTAESGHFEIVDGFYYDVVREEAPGLYTQMFTVPEDVLVLLDDYPNLAGKTPESLVKQDPTHINPAEVSVDDNDFSPVKQTGMSDGDRSIDSQNHGIDQFGATPASSYTGKYLEG